MRITCDCCTACEEGSVNKKVIKSPRLKAQCNSGEGRESTAIPLQVLLPYSDLIAEDLLVATYALTQPQLSVCTAAAFWLCIHLQTGSVCRTWRMGNSIGTIRSTRRRWPPRLATSAISSSLIKSPQLSAWACSKIARREKGGVAGWFRFSVQAG